MAAMDEPTCWKTDSRRRRDGGAANKNASRILICKQQFCFFFNFTVKLMKR